MAGNEFGNSTEEFATWHPEGHALDLPPPASLLTFPEKEVDEQTYITPSREELGQVAFDLAMQIYNSSLQSGVMIDVVIPIGRSGLTFARDVADGIGSGRIFPIEFKSRKGMEQEGLPVLTQKLQTDITRKNALILDGIIDKGDTMLAAVPYIESLGPANIITAGLALKPKSKFIPNHYGFLTDAWIVKPHERGEFFRDSYRNWSEKGVPHAVILSRLMRIGLSTKEIDFFLKQQQDVAARTSFNFD